MMDSIWKRRTALLLTLATCAGCATAPSGPVGPGRAARGLPVEGRATRPGETLEPDLAPVEALPSTPLQDALTEEQHASGLSITPRLWFAQVGPVDEDIVSKETYTMPLFGATATWSPGGGSPYSFLATLLVGEGDGDIFVPSLDIDGDSDSERVDLELLARYNSPGRGVFLFVGPRFVTWEEENEAAGESSKLESEVLILEGGVGLVTDLTEDGSQQLFGNLIVGLAFDDWDWESTFAPDESGSDTNLSFDINLGYQRTLSASSHFGARYRAFILTQENDFSQENLQVFHGPEIGLTFSF